MYCSLYYCTRTWLPWKGLLLAWRSQCLNFHIWHIISTFVNYLKRAAVSVSFSPTPQAPLTESEIQQSNCFNMPYHNLHCTCRKISLHKFKHCLSTNIKIIGSSFGQIRIMPVNPKFKNFKNGATHRHSLAVFIHLFLKYLLSLFLPFKN